MNDNVLTMSIQVSKIVQNTGSNLEGEKLFNFLVENLDKKIVLEFDNNKGFSSSFLNSSIGEYIEVYGLEKFKKSISLKCTKNQFQILSNYINNIKNLVC